MSAGADEDALEKLPHSPGPSSRPASLNQPQAALGALDAALATAPNRRGARPGRAEAEQRLGRQFSGFPSLHKHNTRIHASICESDPLLTFVGSALLEVREETAAMSQSGQLGRFLQSVEERDIDLLLMEEFHVTPEFVEWFSEQAGLGLGACFDGAWHSLSDHDGETDLMLRVVLGSQRLAVLIENKIAAPEQTEQDLRYHLRGARGKGGGHFDDFVTAICAPQVYLDGLADTSAYQHRVPYEDVRDWYAQQPGRRAAWRRSIMEEAIEQGRRGYVMKVHAGKTAFHLAYWQHLQRHYPALVMARPGPKGAKSNWILLKGVGFPKGVKLVHKNDQGCVDLEFERTTATDLSQRRRPDWLSDIRVVQRGKSAALSLPVPRCDMNLPFADQIDAVDQALGRALELMRYATSHAEDR